MTTSVAEDLLLLLLDDASGAPHGSTYLVPALGGALLVELDRAGRVEVVEHGGLLRRRTVRALGTDAPTDALLAAAWTEVAHKERSPQHLVTRLGRGVEEPLAGRLVEQGVLERRDDTVLGLFHRTRWPERDGTREAVLRRELTSVLVGGAGPDPRTAALVALLHAVGRATRSSTTRACGPRGCGPGPATSPTTPRSPGWRRRSRTRSRRRARGPTSAGCESGRAPAQPVPPYFLARLRVRRRIAGSLA
ncbi:GOLPH3/VPS74 family protein [Nocardioides marinisabuli]|uniref:GOLPH3/VPS74 family protein n=1 Tax=Nocardioides marinisabuli TaxID=419476 RepID=UPI0015DDE385|nr:GPP34 family phosphoprotein [Nocardioides marinisabuli]